MLFVDIGRRNCSLIWLDFFSTFTINVPHVRVGVELILPVGNTVDMGREVVVLLMHLVVYWASLNSLRSSTLWATENRIHPGCYFLIVWSIFWIDRSYDQWGAQWGGAIRRDVCGILEVDVARHADVCVMRLICWDLGCNGRVLTARFVDLWKQASLFSMMKW